MLDLGRPNGRGAMTPRPFRVVDVKAATPDTSTLTFEPADGEACFDFDLLKSAWSDCRDSERCPSPSLRILPIEMSWG